MLLTNFDPTLYGTILAGIQADTVTQAILAAGTIIAGVGFAGWVTKAVSTFFRSPPGPDEWLDDDAHDMDDGPMCMVCGVELTPENADMDDGWCEACYDDYNENRGR